jgi:hypothetical protein
VQNIEIIIFLPSPLYSHQLSLNISSGANGAFLRKLSKKHSDTSVDRGLFIWNLEVFLGDANIVLFAFQEG